MTMNRTKNFLCNDLKIPREDEENILIDRVHSISLHQASSNTQKLKPRPIIVNLSHFQDKEVIKSFINNLIKGCNLAIYNDFPKEVEEIRKKLHPVLKATKRETDVSYFKVEKLYIDGSLYHGPETKGFPLYGR